ncbi:acyl-CoA dehydrogenase family protein [Actinomadura sp. B10D3]|uniref:acyl-CoA dehydrogenase family protein n=1 Tax=Actinomadura sp. B10D3 TaxID=3153557 RepID=UPI00325EA6D8
MDMLFTDEQEAMVASLGRYLADALPLSTLHAADQPGAEAASPASDRYWQGLAELGLFVLGLPEHAGGAGLGVADEVAVFREAGRHLAAGPVLGTVIAAHTAVAAGAADIAGRIADGVLRAAVAFRQTGADLEVGDRVSGTVRVHDLETADVIVVVDGDAAALVPAAITPHAVDAVDPTAPVTIGALDASAIHVVHDPGIVRHGRILQAAIFCGMAEATRDDSAAYARTREQFGKPIGAFQAVKHRCAEMAVRAEAAFFQTVYAALVEDEDHDHPDFHAAAALAVARDASEHNGADNVQNHGGMGFTAEADAHLFVRRHLALAHSFGSRRAVLETVAAAGDPAVATR